VVHEIQLFQTIFKAWDGSEVYTSNVKLYESTIINHQRASEQWEKLELEINLSTSDQQLSDLRNKVSEFLKNNPHYYYSLFQIAPKPSSSMEKLQFSIKVKCKATTDSKRKWERHGKLLQFMRDTIESLGIVYYTPSG
jgi:small-conductance mechanosensitive channel